MPVRRDEAVFAVVIKENAGPARAVVLLEHRLLLFPGRTDFQHGRLVHVAQFVGRENAIVLRLGNLRGRRLLRARFQRGDCFYRRSGQPERRETCHRQNKRGQHRQTRSHPFSFESRMDVTDLRIGGEGHPRQQIGCPNHPDDPVPRIKQQADHPEPQPEPRSRHHGAPTPIHFQPVPPNNESAEGRRKEDAPENGDVRAPDRFAFRRLVRWRGTDGGHPRRRDCDGR